MGRSFRGTTIERVEVLGYDLRYAHGSYAMSGGRTIDTLASTVVRVITADGAVGYGEACPLGATYLPAHAAGVRAALGELVPALVGLDLADVAGITARLDRTLRGHPEARSAIDVACWDAWGRTLGVPVWALLGGRAQSVLPLYVAVPLGEPEAMAAFTERERAGGVHRFQLKLGGDPVEDTRRAAAVVAATGPEDQILGDANGGWRRQDAIIAAGLMADLPRYRLEQPCPTLDECLAVRHVTRLPMVLDEVITDLGVFTRAVAMEAMDHINLKIGRVGGLTTARSIRDSAIALGIRLTIEDSWGGDIVSAAVAHLAAAVPSDALFAVSFMNDWTLEHVAGYQPRSAGGAGPVPDGPGLGIDVDSRAFGAPLLVAR
jgi:L-alanine-DL-glutamate epimerase-like enolase superfamily enzyme